jgi:hypothetical protein
MTKFMLVLAAATICGPLAANAAVTSSPMLYSAVTTSTTNSAGTPKQATDLSHEVMALNNEVKSLEQQNEGTNYSPQLAGIIPTGG